MTREKAPLLPTKKTEALVNIEKFAEQKIQHTKALQEVQYLDLKKLLEESLDGLAVLNSYKYNNILENDDRTTLTDILIKWILFRNTRVSKVEFIILRNKILALFPNEENVYYTAPGDEGQVLAKGKLFDRMRNLNDWMRKKQLLPPVQTEKKVKKSQNVPSVTVRVELTDGIKVDLECLKKFREDMPEIKRRWARTSNYRLSELMRSNDTVADYTNTYNVLKQSLGYQLIGIDFASLHKEKEDFLLKNWQGFVKKVLKVVKTPNTIKDPAGKIHLHHLPSCKDDAQDLVILQLLPSVLPPNRVLKLGIKKLKPSTKECRDSLVISVKNASQIKPKIRERRAQMAEYGPGATVQPYIMTVSPNEKTVEDVYVCIDDFHYKLGSVLEALVLCFKSFFALNCKYPVESEHIWLVIQKGLYNIGIPGKDPSVNSIKSFLKKLEVMTVEE